MIDVMMPFYGDASLMRDAVQSVIAQSSPDWRLTVIDDCDPALGVGAWVSGLDHPQVAYVRNERRLGVSANFRRSLALASAPYVTFMGCDDLLGRDYVATVSETVQARPGVAAVQPRVQVIDGAGRPSRALTDRVKSALTRHVEDGVALGGEDLAISLLHGNWTYFPAICWRRDLVDAHSFRSDMETVLDFDLLLGLVLDGHEFMPIQTSAFAYRRHSKSASALTAHDAIRFDEEARLFDETARRCAELGWSRAERAARWHVTSRLHAALLIPRAVARRDAAARGRLIRHTLGRSSH